MCGKGADAAALTSLTRYTLRAAAIYDPDPCTALANLDAVLKGEYQGDNPRFCTAVFGVLEAASDGSFTVTLAGGGHPRPWPCARTAPSNRCPRPAAS